ncbi:MULTISPECIES: hypothetical protein [unclassified Variovorax]|uniref:hypothetical protein n=1 Tax=unclassified Variovorax TaxID=663243 RepID=UPI002575549D|nr:MULTISPECIES: hypothetical protein [unclassified Variovorax]MDM0090473.1 hypothetical protein [Variovorax sp. J22G40]MDM0147862.1 hypothetical protein [Variovorax sp. J2P1-31]
MKFTSSLLVLTLVGVCAHVSAQEPAPVSLCAANEEPIFSCTLQGPSRKVVSLCASTPSSPQGKRRFHYLYGRPSKIELRYPSNDDGDEAFTFTHLHFSGATAGYAYAFTNMGFKYIMYWISGTGFERSGLLVQREGQLRADRDMHCKPSAPTATKSHELWDATSKWKVDPDIDAHNLPSTH